MLPWVVAWSGSDEATIVCAAQVFRTISHRTGAKRPAVRSAVWCAQRGHPNSNARLLAAGLQDMIAALRAG